MSPELQAIVNDAALVAARHERALSIEDIALVQARCEADGIEVVKMSTQEQARFAEATKSVYTKYENYFTAGLVDNIKKA